MKWGAKNENGIWLASSSAWTFLWRDHDALYVSAWRLRLRIMKPWMGRQTDD